MVAKMASIGRILDSDPQYEEIITTENLLKFIDSRPETGVETTDTNGQRELVFNPSPQHRFAILKLIADDFLESRLSGRNYEAGSKQRL